MKDLEKTIIIIIMECYSFKFSFKESEDVKKCCFYYYLADLKQVPTYVRENEVNLIN